MLSSQYMTCGSAGENTRRGFDTSSLSSSLSEYMMIKMLPMAFDLTTKKSRHATPCSMLPHKRVFPLKRQTDILHGTPLPVLEDQTRNYSKSGHDSHPPDVVVIKEKKCGFFSRHEQQPLCSSGQSIPATLWMIRKECDVVYADFVVNFVTW